MSLYRKGIKACAKILRSGPMPNMKKVRTSIPVKAGQGTDERQRWTGRQEAEPRSPADTLRESENHIRILQTRVDGTRSVTDCVFGSH